MIWRVGTLRRSLAAAIVAASLSIVPAPAAPADALSLCHGNLTDDAPQEIPESLIPDAVRLFGLEKIPAGQVRVLTLYRCAEGRVLICSLGANLPCGKANTSRDLPAADAWCAENPGSEVIPMYITGHDTIYRWHCDGTKAATSGEPLAVDRRGFISRYWKPIGGAANPQR